MNAITKITTTSTINKADSYKTGHFLQYPDGISKVVSYIESRGGLYDRLVFFGLQAWVKENLLKPITMQDIDEMEVLTTAHGDVFNRGDWETILREHKGFIPVKIRAIPEGMVVGPRIVLATIENTDPRFSWLPQYLETNLLRGIWYPTTVATRSFTIKGVLRKFAEETAENEDLSFSLHDFGGRGATCSEQAVLGGMAHLVNFMGSDTLEGMIGAMRYYNADKDGLSYSVPAAEHSTITSWGSTFEDETAAYENMLDQFLKKGSIVSVVSDSYDLFRAVKDLWGDKFKDRIEKSGGRLVVRPDSGEPKEIVLKTIEMLMDSFGFRINSKGYKVLPDCVRVIQGDGITETTIDEILNVLKDNQISSENVVFGCGGYLLQGMTRDTLKFAQKACEIVVNGEIRGVNKNPATDHGKASKLGRHETYMIAGKVVSLPEEEYKKGSIFRDRYPLMRDVYVNGKLIVDDNFKLIRERANV
ncbi:nicotinate phosphoribosyltransferase [Ochrobactrum phage vB_OspM_OC]|nr:nicotinate phosphoribosyltransferase [Ochrobactrum phage vB_OspM_OC]